MRRIRKLESIVVGLLVGVRQCGWIGLVLFLVFYSFAVGAVFFFGDNDPLHFRTLPVALLSLFRAATMEDWTDLMYISMYGCDRFSSGLYYVRDKEVIFFFGGVPNANAAQSGARQSP